MPKPAAIRDDSFQLTRDIGRLRALLVERAESRIRTDAGLSFNQFLALKLLGDDRPLSVSELARALHYNPGALTRLLDGLQAQGLLIRQPVPTDRRAVRLELTASGKGTRRRLLELCSAMSTRAFACLARNERRELHALLSRVLTHVQQSI